MPNIGLSELLVVLIRKRQGTRQAQGFARNVLGHARDGGVEHVAVQRDFLLLVHGTAGQKHGCTSHQQKMRDKTGHGFRPECLPAARATRPRG